MWLQLPVTEGIFREEITKINAPDIASKIMIYISKGETCMKNWTKPEKTVYFAVLTFSVFLGLTEQKVMLALSYPLR